MAELDSTQRQREEDADTTAVPTPASAQIQQRSNAGSANRAQAVRAARASSNAISGAAANAWQPHIAASPALTEAVLGAEIAYSVQSGPEMMSTDSFYTFNWSLHLDPKASNPKHEPLTQTPKKHDHYSISVDWPIAGTHTVRCERQLRTKHLGGMYSTEVSPVEVITLQQKVVTLDQRSREAFDNTKPQDWMSLRMGVEMQHIAAAHDGIATETKAGYVQPGSSITSSGPNPAVPGIAPNLASHTYSVTPAPGVKKLRWSCTPRDWHYMAPSYYGFHRANVGGRDAYDLGTKDANKDHTAEWIIASPNTYVIVCEQLDAHDKVVTQSSYLQAVITSKEREAVDEIDKYAGIADKSIGLIKPGHATPVRASYTNKETGNVHPLNLFIGPDSVHPERHRLVDVTPGIEKVGRADYGTGEPASLLKAFEHGNSYPKGIVELDGEMGRQRIETTGESVWEHWAQITGWVATGLTVLGFAATLTGVGAVAAPVLFIAASALGGVSSGLSLYDELHSAEISKTTVAVDVIGIGMSILSGGAAAQALRKTETVAIKGAATMSKAFIIFELVDDTSDGLLLTAQGAEQLRKVMDSDMSPGDKLKTVIQLLAMLAVQGAIVVMAVKTLKQGHGVEHGHNIAEPGSLPGVAAVPDDVQ